MPKHLFQIEAEVFPEDDRIIFTFLNDDDVCVDSQGNILENGHGDTCNEEMSKQRNMVRNIIKGLLGFDEPES